jgi:histidinol dehydrogenase
MMYNLFRWSEMSQTQKARILARSQTSIEEVMEPVSVIVKQVRDTGDHALMELTARFDKAVLKPSELRVSVAEFAEAQDLVPENIKDAIRHCYYNILAFHQEQMRRVETHWMVEIQKGVFAGEKVTPIDSVGLYVPGGKNIYPSAVYMLACPAKLAGVKKIVITTPPNKEGKIDPKLLFTAELCGVTEIYKIGGAQAIAALAYGTETVPKVVKVLGPGNPYVSAAKYQLSHIIDSGMPAGPSESVLICDESANPETTIWDLLNESEHGPDSASLVLTHDETLAQKIYAALPAAISSLPEPQRNWLDTVFKGAGAIIITDSVAHSIAIANEYAPEHLLLKLKDPEAVLDHIHHAGEILIGEFTPFSLGNYGMGVNHVLPTASRAKSYSCTSVWDFLKRTSLSKATPEGFASLANAVATMANAEGFPVHEKVIKIRE